MALTGIGGVELHLGRGSLRQVTLPRAHKEPDPVSSANVNRSQTPTKVGVTGHRLLTEIPKIVAGIEEALALIKASYPGRSLTAISALAEGADRLVAEAVLRTSEGKLIAVIPFDCEEYATDFGTEGTPSSIHFKCLQLRAAEVVELPSPSDRNEGYAQGGDYVLDHCDVLMAVWDGELAQGRGGTSEIVTRARGLGKPLVIVRAGNRRPGTQEPTSLGTEQGRVLKERFPDSLNG